jgi:hypothetical protein
MLLAAGIMLFLAGPGKAAIDRSHRKREGMAGAFAGIAGRRGRAVKERAEGPRRALVGPRRD